MKKVAIVTDGWVGEVTYAWFRGIRQYLDACGLDADLYFFHSFGNFSKDEKYNAGEYNIIKLPDFSSFDGIIIDTASIAYPSVTEDLARRIRSCGVPAVSLQLPVPGLLFSGIDNYGAMERIVEHLITVHGCRTINYCGGPVTNGENVLRLKAYRDCLLRHGIPYEEKRVYHYNYEMESGIRIFDHFRESDLIPDAFVCANDNIAVGLSTRARETGFRIPDDFLVTGFDNHDKASYFDPRITTVGFKKEELIVNAMQLLHESWTGTLTDKAKYAQMQWVFQDSCRCQSQNPPDRGQYINDQIVSEVHTLRMRNWMAQLKRWLLNCDSYSEMASCLLQCIRQNGCDDVLLFLNPDFYATETIFYATETTEYSPELPEDEFLTDGYPAEMALVPPRNGCSSIFPGKGELLPPFASSESGNLYLFCPLHFREREIGYLAFKNCDYILKNQFLFDMLTAFQIALETLYGKLTLHKMNAALSQLYIRDSLTGLYNRMAYDKLAIPLFASSISSGNSCGVLFADVDRLKYINDTFGHDMGNLAISTVASALKQCCPSTSVTMRYGGDEFVCLIPNCNEEQLSQITQNILTLLRQLSNLSTQLFSIEASIGYVVTDDPTSSLNDYINRADEEMYLIKKARKAERTQHTD